MYQKVYRLNYIDNFITTIINTFKINKSFILTRWYNDPSINIPLFEIPVTKSK